MKVLHYKCPRCGINFWVQYPEGLPTVNGDTCPGCQLKQKIQTATPMEIIRHYPEEWEDAF